LTQEHYSGAELRKAVGRVLYDAISDDGKTAVTEKAFDRLVALASG
jgi:hypothetical protein